MQRLIILAATLGSVLLLAGAGIAQDQGTTMAIAPPSHPEATFATHNTDPQPTIQILFPQEGQTIPAGEPLKLQVDLQGLELGDGAFHVHVWVDDQPYKAMYDATQPFLIEGLEGGAHSIRVAPSRPWHELFKNPGAFAAVNFSVEGAEVVHSFIDHSKPTLTYSRPKKNLAHTFDTSRNLIFDWYVSGLTLGEDGNYLRVTIDGVSYLLTSWSPMFVENPQPGEHVVKLELMNKGELVDANFNPFTATWSIDPPLDPNTTPAQTAPDPHAGH